MDIVSADVVHDVLQPNYTPLVMLEASQFLSHFIAVLTKESNTLQVPNNINRCILCMCVLVCKTYSFNPTNVKEYSDTMISCCWQRIERCVTRMRESYGMGQDLCNQLLKHRSSVAYSSIATARGLSNMVSLTTTPHSVLTRRDEIIQGTIGSLVQTSMSHQNARLTFRNPTVYRSLYECIMCHIKHSVRWYSKAVPVEGEPLTTPFLYDDCETLGYMSPKLGMNIPCNVLLRTGNCWTELHDDQSVNPILYLDTCAELDTTIESELHRLLRCYDYDTPLSMELCMDAAVNDQPEGVQIIRQPRQCMSIGSIIYNEELIRVWMVRPTINYTTYAIKTTERMRDTHANACALKFRSVGNYEFHELSIQSPASEPDVVLISGTMAHYYINTCNIDARIRHASIGGSLLRVHQIRDFDRSPKVTDICMNMGILRSLTSNKHRSMTIEIDTRCVRIKYHTSRSLGTGPCLIIGENGGFQWLGNPSDISESLSSMFAFMNSNMRGSDFMRAIAASRCMIKYVYPSGIRKAREACGTNRLNIRATPLQF